MSMIYVFIGGCTVFFRGDWSSFLTGLGFFYVPMKERPFCIHKFFIR
jgi:hypothetical protein